LFHHEDTKDTKTHEGSGARSMVHPAARGTEVGKGRTKISVRPTILRALLGADLLNVPFVDRLPA